MRATAAGALAGALLVSAARAEDAPARTPGPRPSAPPTLEWLRECVLRKGVSAKLAKIETTPEGGEGAREGAAGSEIDLPSDQLRRLVFWTRTRRITQSVVVAVLEAPEVAGRESRGAYVRVQSAGLARVPPGHPRLAKLMAYMLDRNFVLTGAQFARDASDGEVVIRADVPCASGLAEGDFLLCLESVLAAADAESARIGSILEEAGDGQRRGHAGYPSRRSLTLRGRAAEAARVQRSARRPVRVPCKQRRTPSILRGHGRMPASSQDANAVRSPAPEAMSPGSASSLPGKAAWLSCKRCRVRRQVGATSPGHAARS